MNEQQDNWLTVAMADNDVVAELLLRLRLPVPPSSNRRRRPAPPQSWTIHQRRSRTQPPSNKSETPSASPTTPLSWSGGATSFSGGVDKSDKVLEALADVSRSKVCKLYTTSGGGFILFYFIFSSQLIGSCRCNGY
ncbi:hypothetical protein Hanom_Chr09g00829471 [Helianthus anomalus]